MALCLVMLSACEVPEVRTTVKLASGPSFSMRGSGRLAIFTIYAPPKGQRIASPFSTLWKPQPDIAPVLWQFQASDGYFKGAYVEGLEVIYGKLPDGYIQTMPNGSKAAPPLPAGAIYSFSAETTGAGGAGGHFYVDRSGVAQAVAVPDLCRAVKDGHEERVNCTTKEPYQEPDDLEKYVQQHRTAR